MKNLLFTSIILLLSTSVFSQFIKTDIMWTNIDNKHIEDEHIFRFSYGKNKDVDWYYNVNFNETFIRKTKVRKGKTKTGEFFKGAIYLDSREEEVFIQYFPFEESVRVSYIERGLIIEFLKYK